MALAAGAYTCGRDPSPASRCAKALKQSTINSKINWSESKGSMRRESRMGRTLRGAQMDYTQRTLSNRINDLTRKLLIVVVRVFRLGRIELEPRQTDGPAEQSGL